MGSTGALRRRRALRFRSQLDGCYDLDWLSRGAS